jgi:hypothetical protein
LKRNWINLLHSDHVTQLQIISEAESKDGTVEVLMTRSGRATTAKEVLWLASKKIEKEMRLNSRHRILVLVSN